MKKLIILFFILFTLYFLPADTHIPSGDVSGTWTIEGSPYIIDGFVTVPIDSTLIIEPSVLVIFSTNNGLQIEGRLLSEGTENDSIIFTVQDSSNNTGLGFYHTDITNQDSSKITYSIFEHVSVCFNKSSNILFRKSSVSNCVGWSGVFFDENSSPTLIDITITNNTTDYYGGGIYCTNSSNPSLVNVTITGNTATGAGGIWCNNNSNPTLENVSIENNSPNGFSCTSSSPILNNVTISGHEGGGFSCSNNSNPAFDNVIISNNSVWGGLFCINSSPILNNVIISGNSGGEFGGGIYFEGTGSLLLQNFIITGNSALGMGGGVAVLGADLIMVNGIVADNYANDAGGIFCEETDLSLTNVTVSDNNIDDEGIVGGIGCQFNCDVVIVNSILWNNENMELLLYGYGCTSDVSYTDIQGGWQGTGNIDIDPMFSDDEFHLSEDSPCIDTGNPDSLYYDIEDPDNPGYALYPAMGTILNDMGTYGGHGYYEPPVAVDNYELEIMNYELYNYPNPFNPETTIYFETTNLHELAQIEIYNVKGQKIDEIAISNQQTSVSWNAEGFASGIYLYKLNIKDSQIKKMLLLK